MTEEPPTAAGERGRLLVVDDDAAIRKIVRDRFRAAGYEVDVAAHGDEALSLIDAGEPDLVLLDLQMPGKDGFAVLEGLRQRPAAPAVVVLTAHGSIEAAVRAVRLGASDFVTKPFDAGHVEHVVGKVLDTVGLRRRVDRLESELSARHSLVVGGSRAMRDTVDLAMRAAASDATVLLLGESGTGKEVLARAIHRRSRRAAGPFVAINCAALGAELLESELFGHERGAFTGAARAKPGRIESASGGTLFLDEIGELPLALQPKLLRVLQEREYERVGGTRTLRADVRLITATNRDLPREVAAGRFREDLFYRIHVVSLRLPPLRDRPEDVRALLDHFLRRFALEAGRPGLRFSAAARRALEAHAWPGNVRELANVVERAVVLSASDEIELQLLPEEMVEASTASGEAHGFHEAVLEAKRAIIRDALARTGGHQTRAAELLGLTQPYLARLIKNLALRGE